MSSIRTCGYCGTEKNKPYNEGEGRWKRKKAIYCNSWCRDMSMKVNAQGYLEKWLFINEITNVGFLEKLSIYYDMTPQEFGRILGSGICYRTDIDGLDFVKMVGCTISDFDGRMEYVGGTFDVRMLLRNEVEKWDYEDDGYKSIWNVEDYKKWYSFVEMGVSELEWKVRKEMSLDSDWLRSFSRFKKLLMKWGGDNSNLGVKKWKRGMMELKNGRMDLEMAKVLSEVLEHHGIKNDYRKLIKRIRPQYFFKLKKMYTNG